MTRSDITCQEELLDAHPDDALIEVRDFLLKKPDLLGVVGRAIRKSFDEVIDGPRTGRYCIEQLEKTEKTYIGTKVEIVLRAELGFERGKLLDNLICGHEVDTKFTVGRNWTIPEEAVNQICLVVTANDRDATCSAGLLRMTPNALNNGKNRDGKTTVSGTGRAQIVWLVKGAMPRNLMLDLPDQIRERVMSPHHGKQRLKELFRNVHGRLIPRSVILQLGRQDDSLKRAREMKEILAPEGIQVLCSKYKEDQAAIIQHGFPDFGKGDWLAMKVG